MRKLFLIGELEDPAVKEAAVEAVRSYLDKREDVKITPTVLVNHGRLHVVGIPDAVAEDLRSWFAGKPWE